MIAKMTENELHTGSLQIQQTAPDTTKWIDT